MSVVKMGKIRIIGIKEDQEEVIKELQKSEIIHIKSFEQGALDEYFSALTLNGEERHIAEEIAHIESALSFLEQFNENRALVENFFPARVETDEKGFEKTAHDFNYKNIIKNINDIKEKISKIEERIASLHSDIALLAPFKDLSWSPCQARETQTTNSVFLKGPKEEYASLADNLNGIGATFAEIISEDADFTYLLLAYWKENEDKISSAWKEKSFEIINLSLCDKLPSKAIVLDKKRIASLLEEKEALFTKIKRILNHKDKLMMVHDWYLFQLQREKAKKHLRESQRTFVLQGWVREDQKARAEEMLKNGFPATYIEDIAPDEGEVPPIAIKNPPIIRPFQGITKLFGLPHFGEVDPTALIAPFFFIFFGLCLTDAGYGIVLVAITLLAMKKIKLGAEGKQFFRLFLLGGIATIFWGIVTGGWFGIEVEKLPQLLKMSILINPLDSLMKFFILALALGLIQVFFGIGVEMYEQLRNRNFANAFADQLSFLIILSGTILWAASTQVVFLQRFYKTGLLIMLVGGIVMAVSSLFKKGKNPFLWIILGLGAVVWKSKDFLSNVLSYSRLMALGLATSIIALVINILAGIALKQIPYLGIVLAVLIIVGGHLFNITINTLGAFVHTTRLHFVEFFSYFFQNGGEAFQPLSQESKYTISKVKTSAASMGRRTGGR